MDNVLLSDPHCIPAKYYCSFTDVKGKCTEPKSKTFKQGITRGSTFPFHLLAAEGEILLSFP